MTATCGAVLSIVTVSPALFGLPATSLTEQLTAWVPSPETVALYGDDDPRTASVAPLSVQLGALARPLPPSLAAIASETLAFVFQPEPIAAVRDAEARRRGVDRGHIAV